MKRNEKKTERKIKKATYIPGFILEIKGYFHSFSGKKVCDKYVTKIVERLSSIESDEVIHTEVTLFDSREAAAVIITELPEIERLANESPAETEGSFVAGMRAARKNAAKLNSAKSALKDSFKRLTEINEIIINEETILDERISKIRNLTFEKLSAYTKGILRGKIKDYEYPEFLSMGKARTIYAEKHNCLDNKITNIIQSISSSEKEDAA